MCWIGNINNKKTVETASDNLIVYKILAKNIDGKYVAPYMRKIYEVGEMYTISSLILEGKTPCGYCKISEGFHSFSKECIVRYGSSIEHHVYTKNGRFNKTIECRLSDLAVIAECVIPIGATYYENEKGEIVSDTIIITKICKDIPIHPKHFKELK